MTARSTFLARDYQAPPAVDRCLLREDPSPEAIPLDIVIVGAGPAGLAAAIRLAQRAASAGRPLEIGVLEKAAMLGGHCLSGAVVDPVVLRELFPEVDETALPLRGRVERDRVRLLTARRAIPLPVPPPMRNHGKSVASICEIVRWMGERAEALGVHVMTGQPVEALLVNGGGRILGVRTVASGLGRDGTPGPAHVPPVDIAARVTVLAEGSRGPLAQAYIAANDLAGPQPQIYALGIKELWSVPRAVDAVMHTIGWPLPRDVFGGGWIYPMGNGPMGNGPVGEGLLSIGLVAGLDAPRGDLDVHALMEQYRAHPWVAAMLAGGERVEWGARTIPEGGLHALPRRLSGDGVVIVGDAAGFVDVPALKGIHHAMRSGVCAADAIVQALLTDAPDAAPLSAYDQAMRASETYADLRRHRNVRAAFARGQVRGIATAVLSTLTRGALPAGVRLVPADADVARTSVPDDGGGAARRARRLESVFLSGNGTRDDIPGHLVTGPEVPEAVGRFYERLCPAGVYEWKDGRLVIDAPNCIDCRATDVLGPRWTPREGGSGPAYRKM